MNNIHMHGSSVDMRGHRWRIYGRAKADGLPMDWLDCHWNGASKNSHIDCLRIVKGDPWVVLGLYMDNPWTHIQGWIIHFTGTGNNDRLWSCLHGAMDQWIAWCLLGTPWNIHGSSIHSRWTVQRKPRDPQKKCFLEFGFSVSLWRVSQASDTARMLGSIFQSNLQ